MNSFSFRRFFLLVILIGFGVGLGVGLDRWLHHPGAPAGMQAVSAPAPAKVAAVPAPDTLACSVKVSFSNNIYPSILLAFGVADPRFARCVTLAVDGAVPGQSYQLDLASSLFQTDWISTVVAPAAHFELEPDLPWNFAALRRVAQLRPETLVATVTGKGAPMQTALACMVHPVNEVVARIFDPGSNSWVDMSLCYAAFVNEDHPWIAKILQEAAAKDGAVRFSGYQFGPESVVRQMQAIWDALAARGLTYVDTATVSGGVPDIATQYVRFLDQSLREQGANCVDGSVLLASVFRRIGLRPVLLFRPGHCLVAVYDSETGGNLLGVETTMLGSASFGEAFKFANEEVTGILPNLDAPGYSSVDIVEARQQGVRPIEYDDGH